MNWKPKLEKFLENFKYLNDIQGVLVCGFYITGKPTSHSDLDVHIVLKDNCDYRVKLNRIVDGLMIECFINPPKQIRKYFEKVIIIFLNPFLLSEATMYSKIGLSIIFTIGFGIEFVSGCSLVPKPPAIITAFINIFPL